MKYYNVNDIMKITGKGKSLAYSLIRELQKKYIKRFPETIPIQGQIPKWFFDEIMGFTSDEVEKEV